MDSNLMKPNKKDSATLKLRSLYESYGYKRYAVSKFEEYGLYLENKNFLGNARILTFNDTDGRLLALKPDVTLSIAKNTAGSPDAGEKLYYLENVYREIKIGEGFREISQIGLESIGESNDYRDAEVALLALKSLELLDSDCILDVSHIRFITGFFEGAGFNYELRNALINCLSAKNLHDLKRLSKNAGISDELYEKLKCLIKLTGQLSDAVAAAEGLVINSEMEGALKELKMLSAVTKSAGFKDKIRLDFSLFNDESYYNGIVFRGYVSKIPETVLSGGRYDKLFSKFGSTLGATGFAVYPDGLDRYYANDKDYDADVLLLYSEKDNPEAVFKAVSAFVDDGLVVRADVAVRDNFTFKKLIRAEDIL